MEWMSIIVFFLTCWSLGFSITSFVKKSEDTIQAIVMDVGIGLGAFTVLSALLAILHIPLYWWLFLILGLIIPIKKLYQGYRPKWNVKHPWYALIVLLVVIATLFMYTKGAFGYPLYENGDPWRHAGTAKFIADEKSALEPFEGKQLFQYIDSYPPGYDVILGMMYQVSGNIIWTAKFFNALILSLGIFFFYFMALAMLKSKKQALAATLVLAMLPAYMSHFIWAHTLVIALFFPLVYCLEKMRKDPRFSFPAILLYASLLLSQPTQAFKLSIALVIYLAVHSIYKKQFNWSILRVLILGGLLSVLVWWGPMMIKYGGVSETITAMGTNPNSVARDGGLKFHGTADRIYTFNDFVVAKRANMINNPIGIGLVPALLLLLALLWHIYRYKQLQASTVIAFCWLLFAFIGIHGVRLPIQLWAFRFWMLFAIFSALFIASAYPALEHIRKKWSIPLVIMLILIVGGLWFTAGKFRYYVNTDSWENTAGEYIQFGNKESWLFIKDLPDNTPVLYLCRPDKTLDVSVLALNKQSCLSCPDEKAFKDTYPERSGREIVGFAQEKGYAFLFADGNCLKDMSRNKTLQGALLTTLLQNVSAYAPLVQNSRGGFIWKV